MNDSADIHRARKLFAAAYNTLRLQPRVPDTICAVTVVRWGAYKIVLSESCKSTLPLWLDVIETASNKSIDSAGLATADDAVSQLAWFLRELDLETEDEPTQ